MDLELEDNNKCFACGKDNPIGLKLKFEWNEGISYAEFTPKEEHQGWRGVVHGGIISTLLDETMVWSMCFLDIKAMTVQMEVRYRKPAEIGEKLMLKGEIASQRGRLIQAKAQIHSNKGLVAEATGKFLRI